MGHDVEDPSGDHAADPGAGFDDPLDYQPDAVEGLGQLGGRPLERGEVTQPGEGSLHRCTQNCLRKRTSFSKKALMCSTP
jgi:hypothetical protein